MPQAQPHLFPARWRLVFATVAGALAAAGTAGLGHTLAALVGWNTWGVVLLGLSWIAIARADATTTQGRAGSEDPGRTLVYVFVVIASAAGLFAAVSLARNAHALAPDHPHATVALCLSTVTLAWAMTHTVFTLRYAHLYYREDAEGVGGVEFPGKQLPSYFDFAYFAFTIGMCFQVSDTCVTSPNIRRAVLLQALIAFAYNTAILAVVLNLVFGAVG